MFSCSALEARSIGAELALSASANINARAIELGARIQLLFVCLPFFPHQKHTPNTHAHTYNICSLGQAHVRLLVSGQFEPRAQLNPTRATFPLPTMTTPTPINKRSAARVMSSCCWPARCCKQQRARKRERARKPMTNSRAHCWCRLKAARAFVCALAGFRPANEQAKSNAPASADSLAGCRFLTRSQLLLALSLSLPHSLLANTT